MYTKLAINIKRALSIRVSLEDVVDVVGVEEECKKKAEG